MIKKLSNTFFTLLFVLLIGYMNFQYRT